MCSVYAISSPLMTRPLPAARSCCLLNSPRFCNAIRLIFRRDQKEGGTEEGSFGFAETGTNSRAHVRHVPAPNRRRPVRVADTGPSFYRRRRGHLYFVHLSTRPFVVDDEVCPVIDSPETDRCSRYTLFPSSLCPFSNTIHPWPLRRFFGQNARKGPGVNKCAPGDQRTLVARADRKFENGGKGVGKRVSFWAPGVVSPITKTHTRFSKVARGGAPLPLSPIGLCCNPS